MKIKMLAASAVVALSFGATSASADCGEVSITEMDWASSAVVTAVANFLMTQGYGCDVQVVPSSTVPALTSLAETGKPDLGFAREFAEAVLAENPNQLLAYNCSPSFNWKKNLSDSQIASFQEDISAMGYKYQFITLAGIHNMWYNMFDLAYDYAKGEGMKHYVNKVQEPEFDAAKKGYTFASHQQEVGAGYFDDVTTVIQGGESSVTALKGSTEEEQFS